MDFAEYQKRAWTTAIYPRAGKNYVYPALGLAGEAGEITNKIKKIERDYENEVSEEVRHLIAAEIGDLLWYMACLSTELGLNLDMIAQENAAKLADRHKRGVLHGDGDLR